MKNSLSISIAIIGWLFTSPAASRAQTAEDAVLSGNGNEAVAALSEQKAKQAEGGDLNRISIGYRLGFDLSARFKTVRPFSQLLNFIPTTGHAVDRIYSPSNYVRTDYLGDVHYYDPTNFVYATVYWGVGSADQFLSDNTVTMSTVTRVAEDPFEAQESQLTHGPELTYNRLLGQLGRGTWGLEAAFGFDQVGLHDSGAVNLLQTRITDSYQIQPGYAPPPPPYQGTFYPPPTGWPLLQDEPIAGSRTTTINTISRAVTGDYDFDADLFGFRLGPYAEFPLSDKWHFSLSAGLALLLVDSRFSYGEIVAGYPGLSSSGHGNSSDLLVGGYAAGRIYYFLSDTVSLFVGGQWQGASKYRQTVGSKEAQLDVGGRVFFTTGLGFSF